LEEAVEHDGEHYFKCRTEYGTSEPCPECDWVFDREEV
jgi:hypothetical protein